MVHGYIVNVNLTIAALNSVPGHAVSDGGQVAGRLGGEHEVLRHLVGLPVERVGERDGAGGAAVAAVRGGGQVAQRRDRHVVQEVVVKVGGGGGGGGCVGGGGGGGVAGVFFVGIVDVFVVVLGIDSIDIFNLT